jgi:uncharacterized protein (TIGR00255 family)
MIKSMTAFSQASHTQASITANVIIRSYNSRYLDIACYLPETCQFLEEDIRKIINKSHNRGRIEIRLTVREEASQQNRFEVDESMLVSYYEALKKIQKLFSISGEISLSNILNAQNIIIPSTGAADGEIYRMAVIPCIDEASAQLDRMRREEGKNLYKDLSERMTMIEKHLTTIENEAKEIPQIYKQRLLERITYLMADSVEPDQVRISQEAAILADKSDVSEEITRLYSHICQFREILDSEDSGGRKLNFLIQEFNREVNTIGAKAGKASLAHQVVEMKSELEKMREQVQNIE